MKYIVLLRTLMQIVNAYIYFTNTCCNGFEVNNSNTIYTICVSIRKFTIDDQFNDALSNRQNVLTG